MFANVNQSEKKSVTDYLNALVWDGTHGNRHFWPVTVRRFDLERMAEARDREVASVEAAASSDLSLSSADAAS